MKQIRLLARADDAGLSISANKAIRAAVRQGIVRNISLLAPAPEIAAAAELLRDLRDEADFGFHVCFTAEWASLRWSPLSGRLNAATFTRKDGTFPYTIRELLSINNGIGPDLDAMEREVDNQYSKLRDLGFELRYLDEHMGVGDVPGLAERLFTFATEHSLIVDRVARGAGDLVPLPGWNGPGPHPGTELADCISMAPDGSYIVVGHPMFKSPEMERLYAPGKEKGSAMAERNRERRMFTDIEIVDYCENAEVSLIRYSDLG